MMNKLVLIAITILMWFSANAQAEMADDFRGEGKIYVVISIILVILLGFFVMLFKLDRRTKRLKEQIDQDEA